MKTFIGFVIFVMIIYLSTFYLYMQVSVSSINITDTKNSNILVAGRDYVRKNIYNILIDDSLYWKWVVTLLGGGLIILCIVFAAYSHGNNSVRNKTRFDTRCGTSEATATRVITEEEAIQKVISIQNKYREEDLEMHGIDIPVSEVPVVHPIYIKASFYKGEAAPAEEKYQPSTSKANMLRERVVRYEHLLKQHRHAHFIGLIGFPGSGKTTCSKRLAKCEDFVCFHMKFLHMNYKYDLTLKELILDKAYPMLDREACEAAFRWIISNQRKCIFVLDGLDQTEWILNPHPPKESYSTPLPVSDLIGNLCNKHFLSDVFLIFTSRPHSMLGLPKAMRPDATFLLQDFTFEDMKKLFFAFAGDQAAELWKDINDHASQLLSICCNPLMLQYVIIASLNPLEDVGDILTITRVFATVLKDLRRCDNTRHDDLNKITFQLSRLAYNATCNSTVVITMKQLQDEHLEVETVQDLMVALHSYKHKGNASKVFEGEDAKLYFTHQTLQEYFSAFYIATVMKVPDFKCFVEEKVFSGHWSMVRKFLCGLLVDLELYDVDGRNKKTFFMEKLIDKLEDFHMKKQAQTNSFFSSAYKYEMLDLWIDVRECNDKYVTGKAAECFPTELNLSGNHWNSNQLHACSCILRKVKKRISKIQVDGCDLDSHSFSHIANAIRDCPGMIKRIDIRNSKLGRESIDVICAILHKIEDWLLMCKCFDGGDDESGRRFATSEEQDKIQQALNDLDNTKLKIMIEGNYHQNSDSHKTKLLRKQ